MTEVNTNDIDELCRYSCAYWANWNNIRLANNQIFSLKDRQYLVEPMQSDSKVVCAMKATGGGYSECVGILPTIHGMIKGRYGQGVGYYFPTDTDMQDFVKSRINPLIQMNKDAVGKFVKTGRGSTDSAGLKRIGTSNLYLRGSTLNPGDDGGSKKSIKLTGIQFDRLVVDEIDQVDPDALSKMRGRMANAAVDGIKGKTEERYIANPSDEDRGIDLYWQKSSQTYWHRKCECGHYTNTVKEFLDNPEKSIGKDASGRGFMKCSNCEKPLTFNGIQVADHPDRTDLICYHWSHLDSVYIDPLDVLHRFRNPPEGNLGDVYRLDLGVAYSSQDDKLRKDVVLSNCSHDGMAESHKGPCAMGVDNDDGKHVVIGVRTGNSKYSIVKVAKVDGFSAVHDLAQRYNVKSAVVDLRPNADSAREFQKNEKYKVFLCEYTESPLQDAFFNENTGVVKCYRTGIFDTTHRLLSNGSIVLPRQTATIEDFAQQCCNCVKSKQEDKKRHIIVYRYQKTGNGNDHYRNALNYFIMAASGHRVGIVNINRQTVPKDADNNYLRVR